MNLFGCIVSFFTKKLSRSLMVFSKVFVIVKKKQSGKIYYSLGLILNTIFS